MKVMACLMSFSVLGFLPLANVHADTHDPHGGIHIHLNSGEEEEDCEQPVPNVCMELKPWYHNQHFDAYEDIEDQAERLQDDTAWPGQREEFSDYLMR